MTGLRQVRREILRQLLDRYERGQSFGKPAPWTRDVILKIDADAFPTEFASDGREARGDLMRGIAELERLGAVRVVRHKGPVSDEPREVRIGPNEVARAYELSPEYEPLSVALAEFGNDLRVQREQAACQAAEPWGLDFLDEVLARLGSADFSSLGASRERFKRDRRALRDAVAAVLALARGTRGWERMVSADLFGDSKRLSAIRSQVVALLLRADPRWDGVVPDEGQDILESYGWRRRPGVLRCAGSGDLSIGARLYQLADFAPTAHLPESWAASLIKGVRETTHTVTTVENEYPFLAYVEEAGGPEALGARGEMVVYTAGFPSPVVVDMLAGLAYQRRDLRFRHWGDADVGGLRIWLLLRGRMACPVSLFRTSAAWVRAEAETRGRPITPREAEALQRIKAEVETRLVDEPDLEDGVALIDALLVAAKKVEQERF